MYGHESGSNSVVDRKAQYITGGGVGVNNSSTTASKDTEGLMGDHKNGFGLVGCDIKHTRNGPSGTNGGRNLLTDSSRTPQTLLSSAISWLRRSAAWLRFLGSLRPTHVAPSFFRNRPFRRENLREFLSVQSLCPHRWGAFEFLDTHLAPFLC